MNSSKSSFPFPFTSYSMTRLSTCRLIRGEKALTNFLLNLLVTSSDSPHPSPQLALSSSPISLVICWFEVVQNWHSVSFFNLIFGAAEWIVKITLCSSSLLSYSKSCFQKVVQLSGTSSSVGFWPIERITGSSSFVEIVPLRSWKPIILSTVLETNYFSYGPRNRIILAMVPETALF